MNPIFLTKLRFWEGETFTCQSQKNDKIASQNRLQNYLALTQTNVQPRFKRSSWFLRAGIISEFQIGIRKLNVRLCVNRIKQLLKNCKHGMLKKANYFLTILKTVINLDKNSQKFTFKYPLALFLFAVHH